MCRSDLLLRIEVSLPLSPHCFLKPKLQTSLSGSKCTHKTVLPCVLEIGSQWILSAGLSGLANFVGLAEDEGANAKAARAAQAAAKVAEHPGEPWPAISPVF